jgi:hypothetical protein
VKEAKLSIFGTLDAPSAPSSKGMAEFDGGYTFEMRQKRRQRFLTVTRDELVEAARTFDIGEQVEAGANIDVFCLDSQRTGRTHMYDTFGQSLDPDLFVKRKHKQIRAQRKHTPIVYIRRAFYILNG